MNTRSPKIHLDPKTGRARVRVSHPALPERDITLNEPTRHLLEQRLAHVQLLKVELRTGRKTRAEVIEELGAPLGLQRDPTVKELLDELARELSGQRADQLVSMRKHQLKELEPLRVSELVPSRMQAWERKLRAKLRKTKNGTRAYAVNTVRNARDELWSAIRRKGIAKPWGDWKLKKGMKREFQKATALSEFVALFDAAVDADLKNVSRGHITTYAGIVLANGTSGTRKAELAAWAFSDFAPTRGTLRIERQVLDGWKEEHPTWTRPQDPPKQRRVHEQLVHPALAYFFEWQARELEARGWYRPDGPVFPGRDGTWLNHNEVMRGETFRALVVAAGLPHPESWVLHSLRHTMISLEAEAGMPVPQIMARSGQTSVTTVERYTKMPRRGLVPSRFGVLEVPAAVAPPKFDLLAHVKAQLARITTAREERRARKGGVDPSTLLSSGPTARERERAYEDQRVRERGVLRAKFGALSLRGVARAVGRSAEGEAEAERRARLAYQAEHRKALEETGRREEAIRRAGEARRRVLRSWMHACAELERGARPQKVTPPATSADDEEQQGESP